MKLKRELKLLDVFCIATGAMISSGLFILPGIAHAQAGPAVVISYLLAGLLAMTGMLSQAELVSAMPKAGGTYFYATRSMGPMVGTVDGLITWFSLSLKSALALVGLSAFFSLAAAFNMQLIASGLCLLFIGINLIGTKGAGRIQVILVFLLLSALIFYIIKCVPVMEVHNFENFVPYGWKPVVATAGFVFISYGGLLKVASIAEEVKEPGRNIPLAMIFSLITVTLLYMLVVFVTTGVLGSVELNNSLTPISDGAQAAMGNYGRILLSIAAIMAFITTANAGIMAASRYPLALSRDKLLPISLMRLNNRFKTPHISIIITGVFMIIAITFNLVTLVKAASVVLILSYIFSCLSVIILRESRLQNYQPAFRAPLYPWIQIIGIIGFGFLIFAMGKTALIESAILVTIGIFVYWFYGRIQAKREFALLHLIERITAKELTSNKLEEELKEIIRERDDIVKDRFDKIIEKSLVLDIKGKINRDEFFKLASDEISKKISVPSKTIYEALLEREAESPTAITPTLAIPHIIIDGVKKFDILIARSKEGIVFSEEAPSVHAVFVLLGTRDERNFHLRALAAIAQIVQDHKFEKMWKRAKSKEGLRDVVLLGKRRRG